MINNPVSSCFTNSVGSLGDVLLIHHPVLRAPERVQTGRTELVPTDEIQNKFYGVVEEVQVPDDLIEQLNRGRLIGVSYEDTGHIDTLRSIYLEGYAMPGKPRLPRSE